MFIRVALVQRRDVRRHRAVEIHGHRRQFATHLQLCNQMQQELGAAYRKRRYHRHAATSQNTPGSLSDASFLPAHRAGIG